MTTTVLGVDFTCAPHKGKPITAAWGTSDGHVVRLHSVQDIHTLSAFDALLTQINPDGSQGWVGAFDFPFGLPRSFINAVLAQTTSGHTNRQNTDAAQLAARVRGPDSPSAKQYFQTLVDTWGTHWGIGTRPARLPHRKTDVAMPGITSTSPLQTRYVPVGKMYVEGFWRLLQAGLDIPLLRPCQESTRHALEAYPALLAHELLGGHGSAASYKNDSQGAVSPERLLNRLNLIDRLEQGRTRLALRLKLTPAQRDHIAQDTQGDRLDAVLCLVQAAWAARMHAQGHPCFGLPADADPLEGWILTT